ncbi:class I SAM-dependent methyltransferase [Streptomyces sp. NPDC093510]|uniref:O-methyltransferase n=1 Tax=Streptomyces sp. NPDC093510 TaxID=3155199 RepID=UPI0034187472
MAHQIDSTDMLLSYVRDVSLRDDDALRGLREETAQLPGGTAMQVMAEEGQLLALLVRLTGARAVLELGTFTGYSTLCMARALPADGKVVTCDVTDRWPDIGASYWKRDGVGDRIELRVGDAKDTLDELLAERGAGAFDLVFIDADKTNYRAYYEKALTLTRSGGLLVIDNTLFFGRVADPEFDDADTVAIRELNSALTTDERVDISLLPMADGITLARKR